MTKLSNEQWHELKWKWIRDGKTHPFILLAKEYGISLATIRERSAKDKWDDEKKDFLATIAIKIKQSIEEMFVQAGLPRARLIKLITDGAERTTKLQNVKKCYAPVKAIAKNGKKFTIKAYAIDETIEVIDNSTTYQYRELAARLMGMLKQGEKEGGDADPIDKPPVAVNIYLPDNGRPFNGTN